MSTRHPVLLAYFPSDETTDGERDGEQPYDGGLSGTGGLNTSVVDCEN